MISLNVFFVVLLNLRQSSLELTPEVLPGVAPSFGFSEGFCGSEGFNTV